MLDTVKINPEALEVANCYLQNFSVQQTADLLDMPVNQVSEMLKVAEVKSYVNHVFHDIGFNNRFKMRRAMDALLQQKFQELEESQTGSSKDIADLLSLSHKMSMDLLDREIQLEKLRQGQDIKNQTNIQINETLGQGNYGALLAKLLDSEKS